MDKFFKGLTVVNTVMLVVIAFGTLVGGNQPTVGATGTRFPNGLSTDTTSPANGEVRTTDLTVTDDVVISGSTATLQVGSNGSAFDVVKSGTCTLFAYDNTIAATTTDAVDCSGAANGLTAISGIASGDNCILFATTTMSSTAGGLRIAYSHSSTTAGYIRAGIANDTGADYTWAQVASTSVRYFCTSQ